jgi:hypothetical protein
MQEHVDIVFQQAVAYAKLLKQFIAHDLDMTGLWRITGYGAFMAGSVFAVSFRLLMACVCL